MARDDLPEHYMLLQAILGRWKLDARRDPGELATLAGFLEVSEVKLASILGIDERHFSTMATPDYKGMIFSDVEKAGALRERIMGDTNLSPEGRRRQLEQSVNPLLASASRQANWWLRDLNKQASQSEARLQELRRQQAASIDTGRRSYFRQRITDAIDSGVWEEVQKRLDNDLASGDVDAIAEWADLFPTKAEQRYSGAGGSASDPAAGLYAYAAKVQSAHAALQPPEIAEAEEQLEKVKGAIYEARAALSDVDYIAERRGEAPVFYDVLHPRPAPTSSASEDGLAGFVTMALPTGNRGPFG